MTHFYKSLALMAAAAFIATQAASAQGFMENATLQDPEGTYVTMAPFMVDITWDNQAIQFTDPKVNEYEDEYADVSVTLGDLDPIPAPAYIMSSLGPDGDFYYLDIALYELDELWSFEGDKVIISIPEGIVENEKGEKNPKQDFTFTLVKPFEEDSYEISPEAGETVKQNEAIVTITFNNSIEYMQGSITATLDDPAVYIVKTIEGKISDKKIELDLTSLEPGGYDVLIPEGYVKSVIDDELYINEPIYYYIIISETDGVKTVDVKKGNSPIFNLNGVKVGQTDGSKVKPGIYIIDGKKVILK